MTNAQVARTIPPHILSLLAREGAVEDLSDGIGRLGWRTATNYPPGTYASLGGRTLAGPVLTARYACKQRLVDDEQQLGHARLADAMIEGAIVVTDARDADASVLGGNAAATLKAAGASACILDGLARDLAEAEATGLAVVARRTGIVSGRPTVELVEIGGTVNVFGISVRMGDVAIANAYGLVVVPAAVAWAQISAILG